MAVDLYQLGVQGLLSAQAQISTTGHNITNASTEGYTRQRAEQATTRELSQGSYYLGTGTYVADVKRVFNEFVFQETILANTNLHFDKQFAQKATNLDATFSNSTAVITKSMNDFFETLNNIADVPNEIAMREIALDRAENLTNQVKVLEDKITLEQELAINELNAFSDDVNAIARQIADINEELRTQGNIKSNLNDTLDKRDSLVKELSAYAHTTTVQHSDGTLSVFIGEGHTLVSQNTAFELKVVDSEYSSFEKDLVLVKGDSVLKVNKEKIDGKIGANIKYLDKTLNEAKANLEVATLAFVDSINKEQAKGLDLDANQGDDFFFDVNLPEISQSRVLLSSDNTGNLQASATVVDASIITNKEYVIEVVGTDYFINERGSSDPATLLGAIGAGSYPTTLGFEFTEDLGVPQNGDTFLVKPYKNSVSNFNVNLEQASAIAASSAIEIHPANTNTSPGSIEIVEVVDPETARLFDGGKITVLEDPVGVFTYSLVHPNGTVLQTGNYTPPEQELDLFSSPGNKVATFVIKGELSGDAPNAPEEFIISDVFGVGNGHNAKDIAAKQNEDIVTDSMSWNQAINSNMNQVGGIAASSLLSFDSSSVIFNQTEQQHQSVSGVNNDEEAANLLKYQQAYQAAARIITVAQTTFDTILNSF